MTSLTPSESEELEALRRRVRELAVLNELSKSISTVQDPDEIIRIIVDQALRSLDATEGSIRLLKDSAASAFTTLIRRKESGADADYKVSDSVVGWLLRYRQPLLVKDLRTDPRFRTSEAITRTLRSFLAVPLLFRDRMVGVMSVSNKRDDAEFSENDAELLALMASQSAEVIENARLTRDVREKELMEKELSLARQIQMGLLPQEVPADVTIEWAAAEIPAKQVGGDYYDYLSIEPGWLALAVGDVSGKGVTGALLMSNLQASFHMLAGRGIPAGQMVKEMNALLYKNTPPEKFATFFYADLRAKELRLDYVNAGHNYPMIVGADGTVRELIAGGPPLGLFETATFESESVNLAPRDSIILYSDGVVEAENERHAGYGDDRFKEILVTNRHLPAEGLKDAVIEDLKRFVGAAPPSDDITLVVVRIRPA
jgi:sigma-B regulation protein RsbU (phosphoserine phosphatase)